MKPPSTVPSTHSSPTRFAVVLANFAVFLVAWEAFIGIRTATSNFYFGHAWASFLALAAACVAAAATVAIGGGLSRRPRRIFTLVSVSVFVVAGVSEVIYLVLTETSDTASTVLSFLLAPLALAPFLAGAVYPFILSAVIVIGLGPAVGPQSSESAAPPRRPVPRAVSVGLIISALVVLGSAVTTGGTGWHFLSASFAADEPVWGQPDSVILAATTVGVIALLFLLPGPARFEGPLCFTHSIRFVFSLTLATGILLCTLSTVQVVYADATGIGGALISIGLVFAFPVLALASTILSLIAPLIHRPPR